MAALTLACLCAGLYANVARVNYSDKFMKIAGVGTVTVDQKATSMSVWCFDYQQKRALEAAQVL